MTIDDVAFAARYGPWGLVLGASDGVGAAYAHELGRRGVNVVLVARRQHLLDDVAGSVLGKTGVEARALALDLSHDDATARIVTATADLEIGSLLYCAGADPLYQLFLDTPLDAIIGMIRRNCVVPTELCHHFAPAMVARGHGSIVLVSSAAGDVGAANMAIYAASKGYDTILGEGLWAELNETGVDVLSLVLGATDTPAFRTILASRGVLPSPDDDTPIPGAVPAEQVAIEAIANLANGPTWFAGEPVRTGAAALRAMSRNDAVRALIANSGGIMNNARS